MGRPEIAIVGGSLAALLCATSLRSLPLDITILEQKRKKDMRSTTGISLGSEAQELLEKHVPHGGLKKRAVPHNQCINISHEGKVDCEGLPKGSEGVITISWSMLHSQLEVNLGVETCGHGANISLKYDCQVVSMQEEKEKILLTYRNQDKEKEQMFDLVIGADGARSFVRDTVLPDLKSEYSGHVAWRGEVPKQEWPSQFESVQQGGLGFVRMPESNSYILLYAKPNRDEATSEDNRIVEWCWYSPCKDPSMYLHKAGSVYAKVAPDSVEWATHIGSSAKDLPLWISPAIKASRSLSVTQINSFEAKGNVFLGNKVVLIGQACEEILPYLGMSCDVAAGQSRTLAKVLSGQESWEDRKKNLGNEWGPVTLHNTQSVAAASRCAGMQFRGESDR